MRVPVEVHTSHPWRIRDIAPDFTVEDVWALPAQGGAEDFSALLEIIMATSGPADLESVPARVLWQVRDRLGRWLHLGRISVPIGGGDETARTLPIPGTDELSLADRLPDDLRDTAAGMDFDSLPFVPLYRTDVEYAAEVSNRTVHGVLHLGWVDRGDGAFQGQMAVYVKPRGALGRAYMAFIKPFRYLVVYPALMRQIEKAWQARVPGRPHPTTGTPGPVGAGPRGSPATLP